MGAPVDVNMPGTRDFAGFCMTARRENPYKAVEPQSVNLQKRVGITIAEPLHAHEGRVYDVYYNS